MTTSSKLAVRGVLAAGLSASSTAATPYTVTIPSGTDVRKGDTIIGFGAGNGTHVTNGMSMKDSVNSVNFTVLKEIRQGSSSTHYSQAFIYKTPQDLADGTTITFTPYASSTVNSFCVMIFRALKNPTPSASASSGNSNTASTTQAAPALSGNAPAHDLVLTFDATSSGTLSPPSGFTLGASIATNQSAAIAFVLAASGSSTYGGNWSNTGSQTSATWTVALPAAEPYLVGLEVGSAGSDTVDVAVATATQPGDTILLGVTTGSGSVVPDTVTDAAGNDYELLTEGTGNGVYDYLFAAADTGAISSGNVAVHFTSTTNLKNCAVIACAGLDPDDLLDRTDSQTGAVVGTKTPSASAAAPLARSGELVVAVCGCYDAGTSITWASGIDDITGDVHDATGRHSTMGTKATLTTGTVALTGTLGAQTAWHELLVSLKVSIPPANGPEILTSSLDDAEVGINYNEAISSDQGSPPYGYSIASGSLPPGIALGTGGTISGSGFGALNRVGVQPCYSPSGPGAADGTALPTLTDWNTAEGVLGQGMTMIKWFYFAGGFPPTWTHPLNATLKSICDQEGVNFVPVICWNDTLSPSQLQAFMASIPAAMKVGFCWQQEPELSGLTPAQFLAGWASQMNVVKGFGNPNFFTVHSACGVTYAAASGPGWGGVFLTPPDTTDIYGIDTYQHERGGKNYGVTTWPALGLATPGWSFANWLSLVQPFSKQLAIMEYGVDLTLSDTDMRNARIQADLAYILAAFNGGAASPYPLWAWMYWYRNMKLAGDLTHQWRFTDAPTISTWKAVIAASAQGGSDPGGGAGNGAFLGIPTTAGDYTFSLRLTDSTLATTTESLSIHVAAGAPSILISALPNAITGEDYSEFVLEHGGLAPLTYAITSGALPAGFTLDPDTGEVSGNSDDTASVSFDVTVTDSQGSPASDTETITFVVALPLGVESSTLPTGTEGDAYDAFIVAQGGTPGYTLAIVHGALPTGLSLNGGTGEVTGTPTRGGRYTFSVKVTDSTTAHTTSPVTLIILGNQGRPVSPEFLSAVTGSHAIDLRATVLTTFQTGASPTGTQIPVMDGDVQLDGTAQIRGTLDLTTDGNGWSPVPGESDIQPYGSEIYVERGVKHSGSTEWVGLGYYRIYAVEQDDFPDNNLRITGNDRMSGIVDAKLPSPIQFAATDSVADVFNALVLDVYPDAQFTYDYDITTDLLGVGQTTQDDRYQFLQDLVTSRGKIMYFDHRGSLVITSAPDPDTPIWDVAAGKDGVMVSASRTINRDGMFNAIVAQADGAQTDSPPWAIAYDNNADSPTYYLGTFGKVPGFYSSSNLITAAQCSTAAAALLARILGVPYEVDFSTVPNPAYQPYDPVLLDYGDVAPRDVQIIQTVTIPLNATDAVTATARSQRDLDIATAEADVS